MTAQTFVHHEAELDSVRLHYVTAGEGVPVVLLHGWPQTWFEWRDVIPELTTRYRCIAPDLRGLGDSSCPRDGYDTVTVANDIWQLLNEHLKIEKFFLVGHDWGGPIAFALAAMRRDAVRRLAIIDVAIPGDGRANISQGGKRWHHAFHQTAELPESLIRGREDIYLGWFYANYGARPDAISDEAVAEYLRTYTDPETFRAGLAYYRHLPDDIKLHEQLLESGPLPMPVLALGGAESWGRGSEVVESCRRVAADVRGGVIEDAGHWVPEEQPERLSDELMAFFADDPNAQ